MQRIIIALALITVASAGFTASNYVTAPVVVVNANETAFNNRSGAPPQLTVINAGKLSLASVYTNTSAPPSDLTAWSWSAVWKQLDNKQLTSSNNANLTYTQPSGTSLVFGYAVSFYSVKDSNNFTSIKVYQIPLVGGGPALAQVQLNAPANYTVFPAGAVAVGSKMYLFMYVADKKVNLTSFTIGSTTAGTEVNVGTTIDVGSFQAVWGEALGSNSALIYWTEGTTAKDAVVDLTKGTSTANAVTGYNANYTCQVYSTDKTYYGEYCQYTTNGTTQTYIKTNTNTTGLVAWSSYNATNFVLQGVQPYSSYLAVFFSNGTSAGNGQTLSYEIWDLSKLTTSVGSLPTGMKTYLTVTSDTTASNTRIPAGGLYTLIYTIGGANYSALYQNVNVGLLLSGSYLTAILGFVMTIVAGLFLF